jgi:hypothetical protein
LPRLRSRVRDSSPAPEFREDILLLLMWNITVQLSSRTIPTGEVAKRLCSGLQSRLDGFDSRPRLQNTKKIALVAIFFVSGSTKRSDIYQGSQPPLCQGTRVSRFASCGATSPLPKQRTGLMVLLPPLWACFHHAARVRYRRVLWLCNRSRLRSLDLADEAQARLARLAPRKSTKSDNVRYFS